MKELGEIVEILGNSHVLISSTETLDVGSYVEVFGKITAPELKEKYNLDFLKVPKGEIEIVSMQTEGLYLGATFKEKVRKKTFKKPNHYGGLLSQILGEEVIVEEDGPPSAILDKNTLDIIPENKVMVGDLVGRN